MPIYVSGPTGTTDISTPAPSKWSTSTVTFDGTAGFGLVGSNVNVFDTFGGIIVKTIYAICTTSLTTGGAGTIRLGTDVTTNKFIAATLADSIDAGMIWLSATPNADALAVPATCLNVMLADQVHVQIEPLIDDTTAGVLVVSMEWIGVSRNTSAVQSASSGEMVVW